MINKIRKFQRAGLIPYTYPYTLENVSTRIDPSYLTRRGLTSEESEYETRKNNVLGNIFTAPFNKESAQYTLEGLGEGMQAITPEFLREPLAKVGPYISPLNYLAAMSQGSVNPKVGEEVVAGWDPRLLLLGRVGEVVYGPKTVEAVGRGVGNLAVDIAGYYGNKTAQAMSISRAINNSVKNSELYSETAEIPIEDSYMYHKWEDPNLGFVENGKHYNFERRPGSVKVENGKYISDRFKTNPESDRIWWDITGHNKGNNVLVTKLGGYKISDLLSGAIPGRGVYFDSYRTTERPSIFDVVRFKYDPVGNTYTAYSPFREITTNRMSLDELFTPLKKSVNPEPSTSYHFFTDRDTPVGLRDNEPLIAGGFTENWNFIPTKSEIDVLRSKIKDLSIIDKLIRINSKNDVSSVQLSKPTLKPKKTSQQRSKEYYAEKKEDKSQGVYKKQRSAFINQKALTQGNMSIAGAGRPSLKQVKNAFDNLSKYPKAEQKAFDKIRLKLAKKGYDTDLENMGSRLSTYPGVVDFLKSLIDKYGHF